MSDLIDRKEAIDAIKKEWKEPLHSGETWEIIKRTCYRIYNLPSAEPKKGHWIGISYDGYADGYPVYNEWECSCCGVIEEDEEPTWNYCPNCGAKMEAIE